MTIARRLADFADALRWDALPDEVRSRTVNLVLDVLGNAVCGSASEPAAAAMEAAQMLGGVAEATVVGRPERLCAPLAALVNGTMAHSQELDDIHAASFTHPGAVIVPAALAAGERAGASGSSVLAAIVAGYEVTLRIATAINPSHRLRGFHTTATTGGFGAAVAAGKLLGLSASEMTSALGIAGSQAAGLFAFVTGGSNLKRLHPGLAASRGIMAAYLAQRGIEGPATVFEGPNGFVSAYSDGTDIERICRDLGREPRACKIMEVGIKPYPACRFAHAPIDATLELARRLPADAEIVSVAVRVSRLCAEQTGNTAPVTLLDRQLSTPYGVALALLGKVPSLASYVEADPAALDLCARTSVIVDDAIDVASRRADISVHLADGRTVSESRAMPSGEPETMLTDAQIDDKFFGLAHPVRERPDAARIRNAIRALAGAPTLAELMQALASARSYSFSR